MFHSEALASAHHYGFTLKPDSYDRPQAAHGTAAIYCSFLLLAVGALVARLRGRWVPSGHVRLGRLGTVLNVGAVIWLAFETFNVAWPRASLASPGAAWYQIWAAPAVVGAIAVVGVLYLFAGRPERQIQASPQRAQAPLLTARRGRGHEASSQVDPDQAAVTRRLSARRFDGPVATAEPRSALAAVPGGCAPSS